MLIFPAIDLMGGKAVRLLRGDYAQKTVYADDPLTAALDFARCGAKQMHMVDLDGAKSGRRENYDVIARICRESGLFCEVGGGIRSMEDIELYLSAGVGRVILGTAAVTQPEFAAQAVREFGAKIAVGVDLRDGFAAIRGWTETTALSAEEFCGRMQDAGVGTVICTDISRDGAMRGANRALYRELSARFAMRFIASGGVSTLEDVRALKELGLYGAIIGKAYYTGAIDLKTAIEVAT